MNSACRTSFSTRPSWLSPCRTWACAGGMEPRRWHRRRGPRGGAKRLSHTGRRVCDLATSCQMAVHKGDIYIYSQTCLFKMPHQPVIPISPDSRGEAQDSRGGRDPRLWSHRKVSGLTCWTTWSGTLQFGISLDQGIQTFLVLGQGSLHLVVIRDQHWKRLLPITL